MGTILNGRTGYKSPGKKEAREGRVKATKKQGTSLEIGLDLMFLSGRFFGYTVNSGNRFWPCATLSLLAPG